MKNMKSILTSLQYSASANSSPVPPSSSPVQATYPESVTQAIIDSPIRSIVITFIVTLPVPTTYDVAITGDFSVLGKWDISTPLNLKRKNPLEYVGKIKIVIPDETINHLSGSSSSPLLKTETLTQVNGREDGKVVDQSGSSLYISTSSGTQQNFPTLIVDDDVLRDLFNNNFQMKYKYITLLDQAPMSWETANRKLDLRWWITDNCTYEPSSPVSPSPSVLPPNGDVTKLPQCNTNSARFVINKNDTSQLLLNQHDGLFGSSFLRKFGRNAPSLFKPVDSEWIYDHVQLRIYQPTDRHPRLNEEDVLIRTLGRKTRLDIVDTDTYVITAKSEEGLAFQVNIHDSENPDVVRAIAFVTHELLQYKDVGEISAPFIDTKTFKIIGHFKALFLLIKPFQHPENNIRRVRRTLNWQQQSQMKNPEQKIPTTKFIGHRGLGKSASSKNRALISENSMLSFQRSAAVGVDYIEFDVQLTKDLQPVIFHDFVAHVRVDEKNTIQIPVQDLSLQQLIDLGMRLKPAFDDENVKRLTRLMEQRKHKLKRSNSYDHLSTSVLQDDKHKQSSWSITEAFATLKDCFEKVPYHVGFNIEIKWPIETNIFNPNIPRNMFIDHILQCVFDYAGPRHILFSSFDPDICTLLNLKQPRYPVFFLTEAGVVTFPDHRCNSIPAAISFAKAVGLRGIVADCTPIIKNPNWIQMVHDHDLMIATFGEANSLVENIKIQQDMGIDAIICDNVDRVLKNRKKLESEGIDTKQLLSGEPTRLSQWIETQDSFEEK